MSNELLNPLTAQGCLLLGRTGTGSLSRGHHRLLEGGEVNLGSGFGHLASLDPCTRFNKHEAGNMNSQVNPPIGCCGCFSGQVRVSSRTLWCEVFHSASDVARHLVWDQPLPVSWFTASQTIAGR